LKFSNIYNNFFLHGIEVWVFPNCWFSCYEYRIQNWRLIGTRSYGPETGTIAKKILGSRTKTGIRFKVKNQN
jgi:hypothetical protein